MAGDDDDDEAVAAHAADEPTAMWGADDLAELGLDRAPSEPPKGPASPARASGSEASVRVSLDQIPSSPAVPKKKPTRRRSQAVQWVVTIAGAIVLAVVAFFVVRALR